MRQYGCKDNECGAVFQYERICLGKEVEPTFCPECGGGSVGPFEYPPAGMERARAAARAMIAEMDAHPTYQHNWKNGRCTLRGCKAEQPAPHSDRETLGDYINRVVDEPAPAGSVDGDWPTCKHCGSNLGDDDEIDEPDEETGTCTTCKAKRPAPAEKPIVYLSCQYCHAPAGNRETTKTGICYDCKRKMIDEGHAWEENDERKRRRVDLLSVNNTTRTGPDGCLPALS